MSSPVTPFRPLARGVATGLLLLIGPGEPARAQEPAQQFLTTMNGQLENDLKAIAMRTEARVYPAQSQMPQLKAQRSGWTALTWRKMTGDGNVWPILILDGRGQVDQAYDFLVAEHIEAMEWSAGAEHLAIRARSGSFADSPGPLVLVGRQPRVGRIIDEDVFDFALPPDGKHLVYVRQGRSAQAHREVVLMDGSTGERTVLEKLAYPMYQIRRLGPWVGSGSSLDVVVRDYQKGVLSPKDLHYTLNVKNRTLTAR